MRGPLAARSDSPEAFRIDDADLLALCGDKLLCWNFDIMRLTVSSFIPRYSPISSRVIRSTNSAAE